MTHHPPHRYAPPPPEAAIPPAFKEGCANPLTAAAVSLMKLGIPPEELDVNRRRAVEKALLHQTIQVERNDFSGMELMLTCQAQMLHQLFARSAEKYAQAEMPDAARPYGNIALKAQNYCRMTVHAITQMKGSHKPRKLYDESICGMTYEEFIASKS